MDKLILYNYYRSSTSFRVRIALELKQLPYEYKPVHLLNQGGEQNSQSYRKINSMGGVPTLIHEKDNKHIVLGQSMAILEYLDEAFPQSYQLFPKDIYIKSLIKQFCENINADIHAYGNLRTLQYLEKNMNISEPERTKWIHHWVLLGLKSCEEFLNLKQIENFQSGKFCFGDKITAADLLLIPQIVTAQRFKVPLEDFKKLSSIFENCMKNEAFIKAHPFKQIDTPDEFKMKQP